MPHEIETFMYAGETPWHGLGVQVDENIRIEEAIVAAGLNWNVAKRPMFVLGPDGQSIDTGVIATVRETDNMVLGTGLSPAYEILQNTNSFNFFQPYLDSGEVKLHTAGSLRDGKRVFVLAEINRDPSVIVANDIVRKFILLSNSHDGSMAVRVGFTPIRVVCANTLAMAHGDANSKLIRVYHRGNIQQSLEQIRDTINIANQKFEATAEQYRTLAARNVDAATVKAYIQVVFNLKTGEDQQRTSQVEQAVTYNFENGRGNNVEGVRGTVWALYNAATEYLSYERGRTADTRMDQTWFGTGATINEKALKTALALAAA